MKGASREIVTVISQKAPEVIHKNSLTDNSREKSLKGIISGQIQHFFYEKNHIYLDTLSNSIFISTTTCMKTYELTTHQTYCWIVRYCMTKLTFLFAIFLK